MTWKVSLFCGVNLHTSCLFAHCLCNCHNFKQDVIPNDKPPPVGMAERMKPVAKVK